VRVYDTGVCEAAIFGRVRDRHELNIEFRAGATVCEHEMYSI
jgi:hypothetical protein